MDNGIELEQLLTNKESYGKYLPSIFRAIQTSKNKLQTIKDIFLFCKSCLGLSSVPETKLLVMWLIRDIIERQPSEQTMKLVEQILLKKITQTCTNQRKPNIGDITEEQRPIYDDYQRICLQSILIWGKAYEQNKASKFVEAFNQLKQKQIKFPTELKFYDRVRKSTSTLSKIDSVGVFSLSSAKSQSPSSNYDAMLEEFSKYDEIKIFVKDELSKTLKNPSYRVDVSKIMHKLNRFYDTFRSRFMRLSTDSQNYERCNILNQKIRQLLKHLKHDGLDYRQMVKMIQRSLIQEESVVEVQQPITTESQQLPFVTIKQFDIFSILENIHRNIELEQKKAGVFGNYEFSKQLNIGEESFNNGMKASREFVDNRTQQNMLGSNIHVERRFSVEPSKLKYN